MKGGHNKPFDFNERKSIEELIKKGFSCGQISFKINRSKNGVVTEVRRGGGRDYCAETSQKIAENNQIIKRQKVSEKSKGNKNTFKFKQRIENLEMQIEILHDFVKELLER